LNVLLRLRQPGGASLIQSIDAPIGRDVLSRPVHRRRQGKLRLIGVRRHETFGDLPGKGDVQIADAFGLFMIPGQ
jgi:hypothetical protein